MPKYYEEKEKDRRACAGIREDLRTCLLECACIKEGGSVKHCLREGFCKGLQVTFFECKRSMLDNRARFRGRKGY
ncbi:cytochrome c oxidase assembly factor 5 isoform X2 [Sphaerodactylus townsendi]|uniref:Dephospho-CoA kinase (Dephosphocoenzyme A kinase) (COAE) n=1 Tax=Sphaerodactylus townsendi TaxID=933632 RepID=A0ACB8FIR8_9SAUR|nr:cytochrome c oxidase assembly factor 5 isoform X2 [Sphaerodactylus townsendi]